MQAQWHDMAARKSYVTGGLGAPHPRIDAVRGCLAIERGPLVYCIEEADQPDTVALSAGGVHAPARDPESWGYAPAGAPMVHDDVPSVELTAIPYAFWGNRTEGAMRVWIPVSG